MTICCHTPRSALPASGPCGLRAGGVRVARSSTSFQPGTSGNPGGRPKGLSEVIALAREHTELAITTLVDIAKQTKAAPAARVAAASALLDRGWGKPAQAIQATTTNASAVVLLDKGDPVEIAEHYRRIMDGTLVGDDDSSSRRGRNTAGRSGNARESQAILATCSDWGKPY